MVIKVRYVLRLAPRFTALRQLLVISGILTSFAMDSLGVAFAIV